MSRGHSNKKKNKKTQKEARSNNSQPKLETLLETIAQQKSDPTDEQINQISYALPQLDKAMFVAHSIAIVIYAEAIMADTAGQHRDKIPLLDFKLMNLDVMARNRDIVSFKKIWQETIVVLLERGDRFMHNVTKGTYFYSYLTYHLNALIASNQLDLTEVAKAIIPGNLPLLNSANLKRIVLAAMVHQDLKVLSLLLGWYAGSNDKVALRHLMQCACEAGNFEAIKTIANMKVPLPSDVRLMLLPLNNALAANNLAFMATVMPIYELKDILRYAIEGYYYFLASMTLNMSPDLVSALSEGQLHWLLELAAAQMHLPLLKTILSEFDKEKVEALFKYHVAPYLMTDSQASLTGINISVDQDHQLPSEFGRSPKSYQQGFDQAINIVRYFMCKGLFTFSLAAEEKNPKLFGPRACGRLRQWLAYSADNASAQSYGHIRDSLSTTGLGYRSECDALKRINECLNTLGQPEKAFGACMGAVGTSYQVQHASAGAVYPTTRYMKFTIKQDKEVVIFVHTKPDRFVELSEEMQRIYSQLPRISLYDHSFFDCVAVLQDIARIVGLHSHAAMYSNEVSTITGIIHRALLLEHGLKGCEVSGTPSVNLLRADISALSFADLEDWVAFYPRLYGLESHKDCIAMLSEFAEKKQNQS